MKRARAYFVHLLTASGILVAFLATMEVTRTEVDPRRVFGWLLLAVVIDAVDGPLARAWDVKTYAARIDGRTIDDIVDFLTFTFIPLLLVWRMSWVPEPRVLFVAPALLASVLGFANVAAKQEKDGFFSGFPSYWNIFAFYAGIWATRSGPWGPGLLCLVLAVLTVSPLRFLYPNLTRAPWRLPVLGGGALWGVLLLFMIPPFPDVSTRLLVASLVYPAFYVGLSLYLDLRLRRSAGRPAA